MSESHPGRRAFVRQGALAAASAAFLATRETIRASAEPFALPYA